MVYSTQDNVKIFFRHLVEASKHLKERDEARKELALQIEKVNKISKNKRISKERTEKELALLIKKINYVIEKEKRFVMIHKIDVDLISELRLRIRVLESMVKQEQKKNNEKRISLYSGRWRNYDIRNNLQI